MRSYVNLEKLIRIIVMSILSFFMIYAAASGKLQNYVNPRMNVVVILTAVILIFTAIFTIPDLKRKKHTVFVKDYVILLLPVFLACVVPYNVYDSEQQVNLDNSLSMQSTSQSANIGSNKDSSNYADEKKSEKKNAKDKAANPMVEKGETLNVSDEEYASTYLKISADMDYYEGQKIKIKGQFFRTQEFSDNNFVLARMAMVCCAADLQPCGFLYKYNNLEKFKPGQWLSVTGVIHVEEYQGEKMPVVTVETISNAEAAKEKYIYFNRG